jgi:non-heme chloroperoxidase
MPCIQTADHTTLFVTEWGSGAPVVFTPTWGLRSDQWDYQVPALADAGLRCVLYDAAATAVPAGPRRDTTSTRSLMTLAAIEHFDLRHVALVGHSLRTRELVRYLTRHGDARVDERVLVGPTTPMLRQTTDNPDGWDPAVLDANYAAVTANVPRWCADCWRR